MVLVTNIRYVGEGGGVKPVGTKSQVDDKDTILQDHLKYSIYLIRFGHTHTSKNSNFPRPAESVLYVHVNFSVFWSMGAPLGLLFHSENSILPE